MISIDNTIVSDNLIEKKFICHLEKCKGACCVQGDAGAPLSDDEVDLIGELLPKIKPFMQPDYYAAVEQQGFYEADRDGDNVTTCQATGECNFVVYKNNIASCSIEDAYNEGVIDFKKPISCHLYPVRIKEYEAFVAVNYHQWEICSDACSYGESLNVPVFEFLKEPLTRKFGAEWYASLEAYYNHQQTNK
jgi:hypothetical protein